MADTAVSAPRAVGQTPSAAIERPDFEIVPRKGLILVGVVAGLVIAAIAANKLWPLQFLHVTGGAAWTIWTCSSVWCSDRSWGGCRFPPASSSRPG